MYSKTNPQIVVTKRLVLEEIFNGISHGIGSLFSIAGLVLLLLLPRKTLLETLGLLVFGVVLIVSYTISTLYHSLSFTKARKVFRILDHSSIFLLIAGTYTALITQSLRNSYGYILLLLVWCVCIWGVVQKSMWFHKWKRLSLLLYLGLGWLGLLLVRPLLHIISVQEFVLLFIGGICYSVGVIFYSWKKLPFSHMIWHLFVLAGSFCHFFSIYFS